MSRSLSNLEPRLAAGRAAIMSGGAGGGLLLAVVLALGYLALAQFVLWLNDPQTAGANFWPAAGLTLAVLLLVPTRRWGWALAAIAIAEVTSDVLKGYSFPITFWLVVADCVEPLLGALLIRRMGTQNGALVPLRGLLEFIAFGVIAAPLVGGSLGAIGTWQSGAEYWASVPRFIVADALGVLVVAPVLLSLREGHGRSTRSAVVIVAATALVSVMALRNWPHGWDTVTPYLVIPFLTWSALRSGLRGTSWAILAMAQIANIAVATGTEPFAATSGTGFTVTLLQAYLAIVASATLILASISTELSGREGVEATLRRQALHDPLTGLPNRLHLLQRLEADLARSSATGDAGIPLASVTMCLLDFDDFKNVNDSHGHSAGDELLIVSGRRLQEIVRETDMVARLGGDEFVVLLAGANDMAIEAITDRIMRRLSEPIPLGAVTISTTVSIGVACGYAGATSDSLFQEADMALYQAKALGRNRVVRFGRDD